MTARLKLWYSRNRNIINLSKYALVSFVLLIVVWLIDIRFPVVKEHIPDILLLESNISERFLSSLSGVFLSVSTFSFATILTVLGVYHSNYSPRILQLFVDKPVVLNVLGTFIGGFFYTILSLFMIRPSLVETKLVAGTFGVIFALVSMLNFIVFIQVVIKNLKTSNVIYDIYESAKKLVEQEAQKREESGRMGDEDIGKGLKIYAHDTGYLHSINYSHILELMKACQGELLVNAQIGKYITKGQYVAQLNLSTHDEEVLSGVEDLPGQISNQFLYNFERNDRQDYHNKIMNLTEIAVRAISPGINDPNTAIMVIRLVSNQLGRLFSTDKNYVVVGQNATMKVLYKAYQVEEELHVAFQQILNYGATDASVMVALLEGLRIIYIMSADAAKGTITAYFDYVYQIAMDQAKHAMDKQQLEKLRDTFMTSNEFANETVMKSPDHKDD